MALKMIEGGGLKFLNLQDNIGKTIKGHYLRLRNSTNPDYPDSQSYVLRLSEKQKLAVSVKGGGSSVEELPAGTVVAVDYFGQLRFKHEESGAAAGTYIEFTYQGKDMKKKVRGKNPHQCTFGADLDNTVEVSAAAEEEVGSTASNIETFKRSKNIA